MNVVEKVDKISKPISIFSILLIVITLSIGIFTLFYFTNIVYSNNNSDNFKFKGKVIGFNIDISTDREGTNTMYIPIVEYTLDNKTYTFSDSTTAIEPIDNSDFDLIYNKKTGEVVSGQFVDNIFPLLFFPSMFIMIPILMIMGIMKKINSYVLSVTFILISFFTILYFVSEYNTWNIIKIIIDQPVILIPILMCLVGMYVFIYSILYNKNKPHYIKVKLTEIKENVAYFNGGWRTGFQSMYHMRIKKEDKENDFFEVNKNYKVNISTLGVISNGDATSFTKLTKSDFIKIN